MYKLNISCVTYKHNLLLDQYIISFLNQTRNKDVKLTLLHDGPDKESAEIVNKYQKYCKEGQLIYIESKERTNRYGHDMRQSNLHSTVEEFWKTDNADNYMVPRALELMLGEIENKGLDYISCNVLHNYENVNGDGGPPYGILVSYNHLNRVNACNWITRASLAKATDWTDYSTGGDGIFIQKLVSWNPEMKIGKLQSSLWVHN